MWELSNQLLETEKLSHLFFTRHHHVFIKHSTRTNLQTNHIGLGDILTRLPGNRIGLGCISTHVDTTIRNTDSQRHGFFGGITTILLSSFHLRFQLFIGVQISTIEQLLVDGSLGFTSAHRKIPLFYKYVCILLLNCIFYKHCYFLS